ncbi:MAG TPA: hypothetical protein VJU84_01450 [Pyrinomonadaceae bacterium]|nr:hypothetical protein [Pyrinomonadaceae bacterium]
MLSLIQKLRESNDADILRDVFYRDGSLRDIYVLETTNDDWQKLLTFLNSGKYKVAYELDSTEKPLPSDFSEIQKCMGEVRQLLSIYIEGVRLNCHFFCTDEIELDLAPNEVDTEETAEAIFRFMAEIGRLLEKEVILTPENGQEYVIVRYDPQANDMEYIHS